MFPQTRFNILKNFEIFKRFWMGDSTIIIDEIEGFDRESVTNYIMKKNDLARKLPIKQPKHFISNHKAGSVLWL